MSWKVAGTAALFTTAALALPACPRGSSKGDASVDVAKQAGEGGVVAKSTPTIVATGHPRLLVRELDVPRLRAWASSSNPIFANGLKPLVEQCAQNMDAGAVYKDDPASAGGYTAAPPEAYAMLFAFYSLIADTAPERDAYAKRARTLLMYVIDKAVKGPADDQPFRDARFSIGDRSRWFGMGFPLTVDWIYGTLSAQDKKQIRTVFLRWAEEIQHASSTIQSCSPIRSACGGPATTTTAPTRATSG
jgi:hypothetical protein